MIIDLRLQPARFEGRFDVCLIGAGAAGISAAVDLVERGYRVVLLESGGRHFERAAQALCAGASGFQGLYNGRCRMLGGTTALWGGQILPIDPHILAGRPGLGGAWPLRAEELADGYARALRLEGLTEPPAEPDALWRALDVPSPDYGEALEAVFSRWCPVRELAQVHARTLRHHPNLTVCLHATVTGVCFHADERTVRAVRVATRDRPDFELPAQQFIMTVGGIETCRLLLQPTFSDGPAPWRRHGWVGRHFQDHIACPLATLHGDRVLPQHFDYTALQGLKYHPKVKLRPEWQRRLGTLDVCGTVAPTRDGVDDLERAFETYRLWRTRQWRSLSPARAVHFARNLHRLLWQRLPVGRVRPASGATLRLWVHCEQAPDSQGRVSLCTERDAFGQYRARVDWHFAALELHSIRSFVRVFDTALRRTGAGHVAADRGLEDDATLTSWFRESFHHLGGARMAERPEQGVVDPHLRVHGTQNLSVCSTAVFPSAGFANPTHTLIALALRLTQHLHRSGALVRSPAAAGTTPAATGHAATG